MYYDFDAYWFRAGVIGLSHLDGMGIITHERIACDDLAAFQFLVDGRNLSYD